MLMAEAVVHAFQHNEIDVAANRLAMHVQRIVTNETCNQNCWFCTARRPAEDPDFIAPAAVRARIDEAHARQPREILLTGGEPTMRSDLPRLVRRAAVGGRRVVLETNATLLDAARARALAAAGLHTARVQLVAWGDEAVAAITRAPGAFAAALNGIRALAAAGIRVELSVPLVRRNADALAALPAAVVEARLPVSAMTVVIPLRAPDPAECAPVATIAAVLPALAEEARRVGLSVRLDPATYIPPCLFEKPGRVAHLYALNRGNAARPDFEHVAACAECLVRDRCPGVPRAMLDPALPPLHPIAEPRLRRRLTVASSIEEQIARELVTRDELRHSGYGNVVEYTLRINFHCNQACEFCFVSTHLPPPQEAAVRETIERAGRERAVLVLSGGEPTLNPKLAEYVRYAKAQGVRAVELQSNGTRLGDPALTAALVDAGIDQAMISLHGATAEVSDAVTGAPGTFLATLRGIDELARTPVRVRLNFVFCQANHREFPRFVDFVAARWPRAAIVFSFVGSHTDVVPRTTALIPRFSDIMPSLLAGLARAAVHGTQVCGFDSMCGLPLCLVPEAARADFSTGAVGPDGGGGEFVKSEACRRCSEQDRCYGVRRGYAELYGTDELRPLTAPEARAPAP
jgi:MoaA/NifB/PqqE/SkfB family radical SAM enzyme